MQATSAELDDLEDLVTTDLAEAGARASRWRERVDLDPVGRRRVRLVTADVRLRAGNMTGVYRELTAVRAEAAAAGDRYAEARAHRLLSMLHRMLGDTSRALEHAVAAVGVLPAAARTKAHAMHLTGLADCLATAGSYAEACDRYESAMALADASDDVVMQLTLLNNVAYTKHVAGWPQEAHASARELEAFLDERGLEADLHVLDTLARVLIDVGEYDEAHRVLDIVDDGSVAARSHDPDGLATALLTLAELHRRTGDLAAAAATLDRCDRVCSDRGLRGIGVQLGRERAELAAAGGRYREAFERYRDFHEASAALASADREARALRTQALYEASEARADRERFREMAVRDQLTGLHNRRWVDERLPKLLAAADASGTVLAVAILDLDHFKFVNDTFSHDVGDTVLRRTAELLVGAATTGGSTADGSITARLGGEEFLVVLPVDGLADATRRCEDLREAIRHHCWDEVRPALSVSASIGLTTARPGDDQRVVLRRADANLYRAKATGRDRVVGDDLVGVGSGDRGARATR